MHMLLLLSSIAAVAVTAVRGLTNWNKLPSRPYAAIIKTLRAQRFLQSIAREFQEEQSHRPKVAICGCGVSGSVAANVLANSGMFEVHTFEQGRGPGGRSSTRRARSVSDDVPLLFDHGAQFIKAPKTTAFNEMLSGWVTAGVAAEWHGKFAEYSSKEKRFVAIPNVDSTRRFVGVPQMNAICKYLLRTADGVNSHFETRINATLSCTGEGAPFWRVFSANDSSVALGDFDWLITTDRSMASRVIWNPAASSEGEIPISSWYEQLARDHRRVISGVLNVPSVVLMVSFPTQLPKTVFPYDSVTFIDDAGAKDSAAAAVEATRTDRRQHRLHVDKENIIGWISRDSSKPQRLQNEAAADAVNAKECWVVQSTADYAQNIIDSVTNESEGLTFQEIKQKVNEIAHNDLLDAFTTFLKSYCKEISGAGDDEAQRAIELLSAIDFSQGHRWSAAFPLLQLTADAAQSSDASGTREELLSSGKGYSYVNANLQFIACGDYFDAATAGRVEGAALSGQHAAQALLELVSSNNE